MKNSWNKNEQRMDRPLRSHETLPFAFWWLRTSYEHTSCTNATTKWDPFHIFNSTVSFLFLWSLHYLYFNSWPSYRVKLGLKTAYNFCVATSCQRQPPPPPSPLRPWRKKHFRIAHLLLSCFNIFIFLKSLTPHIVPSTLLFPPPPFLKTHLRNCTPSLFVPSLVSS